MAREQATKARSDDAPKSRRAPTRDAPSKELRALARRFKQGYRLERTGGGHYRIRDREQRYVEYVNGRDAGNVISLTANPSPGALRAMEEALTAALVLKGTEARPVSDEAARRRAEANKLLHAERARRRAAEAGMLRDRLANGLRHVGGLDVPGRAQDLGAVAVIFAREQGKPMTPDLLAQNAHSLIHGGWVEPRYQEVWNALADRLDAAPEPGGEWYSLVREVKGLPADTVKLRAPKDEEWPFRVELLPLEALFAHRAADAEDGYQRPVSWTFVRREAARFDPALVGTIDVAQRAPSRFAILDGQQRTEIVRLIGKTTIWASVYLGLDIASESRFFLHKNRDRKAIHPFYTFRARLIAEDPDAIGIEATVTRHGYKLAIGAPKKVGGAEDHIAAIAAVEKAYERKRPGGEPTLDPVLGLLRRFTYGRVQGNTSLLIRGLSRIYLGVEELDEEAIGDVLTTLGPELILGRARDLVRNSGGNGEQGVARVIAAEYDKRVDRKHKLRMDV